MAQACKLGPVPAAGWQLWRSPNPPPKELSVFAVACLRDQAKRGLPFGYEWRTTWRDRDVLAIKQTHTWTHRAGKLVAGICIPGITLYWRPLGVTPSPEPSPAPIDPKLDSPAMFDDGPGTDWPIAIFSGAAIVTVCAAFAAVLKYGAGR